MLGFRRREQKHVCEWLHSFWLQAMAKQQAIGLCIPAVFAL